MAEADEDYDKRDRSPKFPYINLTVALERAQQIHASAKTNAVRLIDVARDWGVSPTSSTTLRMAAALLGYGLISDEGSGDSRRIRLTPEALRILNDTRPGVREQLLAEAAIRSPIVAEYYEKWGKHRPTDAHALSTLKFDSGFTERAARTFLGVYDDALGYIPDEAKQVPESHQVSTERKPEQTQVTAPVMMTDRPQSAVEGATEKKGDSEREWLRIRISREVTARILVDGDVTQRMIERLIAVLETQKEVMGDDF
jgi:hypothetical protein